MRVLHVVATNERRGAEVFAADLVRALGASGSKQRVLVIRGGRSETLDFEAPWSVVGGTGRRFPWVQVDLRAVRAIRDAASGRETDVLLAHGGEPLKHVLAALRGDGRRVVYRRIGDARQFDGRGTQEHVFGWMLRRTGAVVAVADALRNEVIGRYRIPPDRVVAIPNAVDPVSVEPSRPRADLRRSLDIDNGAPVVLSLGALTWEKDPVAHVAIVRRGASVAQAPVVHLFAGDGPLRPEVERAAAEGRPRHDVRVLGARSDVGDLLAASDVLLLASRTEGMPASVIEAGMAGVPVAGYALSGIPEVVEDGVTGRLVPPGAEAELADAVASLLRDPDERTQLGTRAAVRCRQFSIEAIAPKYLSVLEEVAGLARRPA